MAVSRASTANRSPAAAVLRCFWFALSLMLGGCYAELDWREVTSKQGGFSVLMPARVHEGTRPLSGIAGSPVMHLLSASAAGTVFGAGYVDLSDPKQTHAAVRDLRDGLVRNIHGTIVSERNLKGGPIDGREFVAEGSIGDARATLNARLLVSGARVYQLAAIRRAGALTPADLEMFFGSFKPRSAER